jgi:hypothetical protein
MLFEFTEPERNTMRRALELYVSELRGEIVKTEKHEWRQAFREEKSDSQRRYRTVECLSARTLPAGT